VDRTSLGKEMHTIYLDQVKNKYYVVGPKVNQKLRFNNLPAAQTYLRNKGITQWELDGSAYKK